MTASITETCSCGATFTASASTSAMLDYSAKKWRDSHKHAESVGICGEQPPPLITGGIEIDRSHCALKAGHAGMHGDGHGGHWSRPRAPKLRTETYTGRGY